MSALVYTSLCSLRVCNGWYRNGWYADKSFGQIDQLRENDLIEDFILIRKFSSKGIDVDEK